MAGWPTDAEICIPIFVPRTSFTCAYHCHSVSSSARLKLLQQPAISLSGWYRIPHLYTTCYLHITPGHPMPLHRADRGFSPHITHRRSSGLIFLLPYLSPKNQKTGPMGKFTACTGASPSPCLPALTVPLTGNRALRVVSRCIVAVTHLVRDRLVG